MCLRLGLCSQTFIHYYFLMSDRQFMYMNARPGEAFNHYRTSTVVYNTIFNVHKLESFDLQSCFEIELKKIQKTVSSRAPRYQQVHLVWLEPRLDILNSNSSNQMLEFRFLMTQLLHRRKALVLKEIQKWFDVDKAELLNMGIGSQTRSGDLDIKQYIKLFSYLKNQPNYKDSTFIEAVRSVEYSTI